METQIIHGIGWVILILTGLPISAFLFGLFGIMLSPEHDENAGEIGFFVGCILYIIVLTFCLITYK